MNKREILLDELQLNEAKLSRLREDIAVVEHQLNGLCREFDSVEELVEETRAMLHEEIE